MTGQMIARTGETPAARKAPVAKLFKLSLTMAASAAALALTATAVHAQDATVSAGPATPPPAADDNTVVVVRGVRASLTKSLANKRKASQVVESVVAEDIGKLPDNNIVEALQRVTGVQVTDRGTGEVGTITIRGLPDVETTWNGRNIFTASGRAEALQDIPSTLVRQIDVYKTRDASQLETGIAGQVDVSTLRPFDFKGPEVSVAVRDVNLKPANTWNPAWSVLLSDRWHTGMGDVGALVNIADTKTKYREESVTPGALVPFASPDPTQDPQGANSAPDGCNGNWTPLERIFPTDCRAPDKTTAAIGDLANLWPTGTNSGLPEAPGSTLTINGKQYPYYLSRDAIFQADTLGNRDRPSANVALQWRPNDSSVYTFEFLYDGYRNTTFNQLLFSFVDWWGNLGPNPAGTITTYPGTNIMHTRTVGAVYGFNSGDLTTNTTDSYVYALNGKWDLGDKLHLTGDLSYQDSTFHSEFTAQRIDRVANQINVNFNTGNGVPSFHFDNDGLLDQASTWNVAQFYDNANRNTGSATTAQLDGHYDADWGMIKTITFGARLDDRKAQEANRTQSDDAGLGRNLSTFGSQYYFTNSNFFQGYGSVPSSWMDANGYTIRDNIDSWRQMYHAVDPAFRTTSQLFLHKTFNIDEKTASAYVMADTDNEVFGHRLRGNFGLRYVNVKDDMTFYNWDNVNWVYSSQKSQSVSVGKVLPSLTLRYDATSDLVLRFNYGETLRRPNFTDLNPVANLTGDLTNVGYGSGSSGNPDLKATTSKNTDLTAEWYFQKDSAIYATLFDRKIEGLVVPLVRKETITGSGLNTNTFVVTEPVNASNGKLDGVELGVIYFPKGLPSVLDGLGFQGSMTSLSSSQNIPDTDTQGNIIGQERTPFFDVSKLSYNATLAYEKGPIGARLSYVWRSAFLDRNEARLFANPIGIWRRPEKDLDFQLSYRINDKMSVDIDGVNLTKEKQQEYYHFGNAGNQNVTNFGTVAIDRQISVGFRWKM
jgi:TonB-dependent receptor